MLAWLKNYVVLTIVPLVALLGMAGVLASRLTSRQEAVPVPVRDLSATAQIPPIDAAQPDDTETATFAAG